MYIPFLSFQETNQHIKAEILCAFEKVFDNAWYILGNEVKSFEEKYAAFNNTKYCIGVSNGLDALHLALKTLNIGNGDEVIVPSNTFIATLLAVTHAGATPVLAEPDEKTYNIDPCKIEAAITSRTKAIIPVHLYGQACEMNKIISLAQKHNLAVVEDNAQAQGARFAGKQTGSWGAINATSFYPGKNLGAYGDAGALTTNDGALANQAMRLRNYGSEKKYCHQEAGYNMRLDEMQAAFLSVKLKYLNRWTQQRRELAAMYNNALKDLDELVLPYIHPDATHVYHLYVVCTNARDELRQWLTEKGIDTLIHYPVPPHLQPAYKILGYKVGDFPVAEKIAGTCLSLPLWQGMQQAQVEYIAYTIKAFFMKHNATLPLPSANKTV